MHVQSKKFKPKEAELVLAGKEIRWSHEIKTLNPETLDTLVHIFVYLFRVNYSEFMIMNSL